VDQFFRAKLSVDQIMFYRRKFVEKNYVQLLNLYLNGGDLKQSFYWKRKISQGYSEQWIKQSIDEFIKLFELIKHNGFDERYSLVVIRKGHKFIRQDGAHRVAIAHVLNIDELDCFVLN